MIKHKIQFTLVSDTEKQDKIMQMVEREVVEPDKCWDKLRTDKEKKNERNIYR